MTPAALFLSLSLAAGDPWTLADYLPPGSVHDPAVPTPPSVLGMEVGAWHVRHDALVRYFEVLAESSPRVVLEEYGRTHEGRALLLATISSPGNLERREELREAHARAARGEAVEGELPVVVWLGYSVHGNEASGANASLLAAYHLAASQDAEVEDLLEHAVVLLDPCINPDGFSRFAQWANSHRGRNLPADVLHREHHEAWPGGRTNHYWFDLNRDWLLATQPETQGRLREFHHWQPNLLADFHEMGSDSTYFFQPGVPSRQNPLTPPLNLELTREIARFHAEVLDRAGRLYYTEESFDDFYYGKGSTYIDVCGGVGILFEQASARGHLQDTSFGPLSFPATIHNQFLTSLSTLRAARDLRERLLDYQAGFYRTAAEEAGRSSVRAYVFGSPDPVLSALFAGTLRQHRIEVYELAGPVTHEGRGFQPGTAFLVPVAQPQYRLLKALFETPTRFADTTFYDVSSWTLPLAFGVSFAALGVQEYEEDLRGAPVTDAALPAGVLDDSPDACAYVFEWKGTFAPRAAYRLLDAGLRLRFATEPFEAVTPSGVRAFAAGTVLLPLGIQEGERATVVEHLRRGAAQDGVDAYAVTTGLTPSGIDLGSPKMQELRKPVPLLVVGDGVSAYEAGEVWHLLDVRYSVPVALVEAGDVREAELSRYTHVILVGGRHGALDAAALRRWVEHGGVIVATGRALSWVEREILERPPGTVEEPGEPDPEAPRRYADFEGLRAEKDIAGAILRADVDLTHPLCFGLPGPTLAVFRDSTLLQRREDDPFASPVRYASEPLISGYVSPENLAALAGSAVVTAVRRGEGVVIRIVDDPAFRGIWYGTEKLLANALFFGPAVKSTAALSRFGVREDAGARPAAAEGQH